MENKDGKAVSRSSVVGENVPRVDAFEKATGAGQYTGDIRLSNMFHGFLLRSPYAHAKVVFIETEVAASIPGVKAIVTYRDVTRKPYNSAAHDNVLAFPPARPIEDQYIFDQKVRFVGDPVAGVIAVSHKIAREAAEAIQVRYEVLPAVVDSKKAVVPGAPLIHGGVKDNILVHVSRNVGNVEEGFRTSDEVLENTYFTSRQKHCQMEPNVCVARFEGSGTLTVWSPTQMPHLVRGMLGKLFDLPMHKVRVISPLIGGGFGNRLGMVVEPYAAAMAIKIGGTVKIEYDRKEDFYGSETRHPCNISVKMGGSFKGELKSIQVDSIVNTGAYATHGTGVTAVLSYTIPGPYQCQNIKVNSDCVYTNNPVSGAFRGYGGVQSIFAIESQIDELCEKLAIDPLEFRMKNLTGIGALYRGYPITSCGLAECIIRGSERICWKEKRSQKEDGTQAKSRGVGMACSQWVSGSQPTRLDATTGILKVNEDGTAHLLMGCSDAGTGSKTTLAQIAAQELGVRFEDIYVTYGDTDVTPFDVGSHASRTCYVAGGAVQRVTADVKAQILEEAAQLLETDAANLLIKDRLIYMKENPELHILIGEVTRAAYYKGKQFVSKVSYSPKISPPSFGAQFAEVEVDEETGKVEVVSFVAAYDCGKPINPQIVRGQIMGGIQQGIGFGLTEEFLVDESGKPLNPNFTDYKVPTAVDMPNIEVILVETDETSGPFGAKSVGESAMVSTAPAIANAIRHATGVRMREIPITPERLFKALSISRDKNR